MKGLLILFYMLTQISVFSSNGIMTLPSDETMGPPVADLGTSIPIIPMIPAVPNETVDENEDVWVLEKMSTIMMESKVKVIVPLEIISDVEIKAMIIDNQKLDIPFEIEMNKEPEKKDYYVLKYSEKELDLDNDGKIDTKIYSPKYINKKIVDDNILSIDGSNITKEGLHRKRVYITVEVKDGK
ncbi:hypothetical protein [Candidatus Cetobacterium colombiensis]|uniref:Gingipain propeptide domain-containing protein n=1 Tax=Candidatus Cetobacterium colombiensis TaxID=3073100 RepID=A0ABU4W6Q7_9FUSO|nr:hypothetical protein [Candidatus Cetobacterium colombiensis]MDX8335202.1 hypothetical protein [Candidatus Cetobacterium colombiensis]